MTTKHNLGQYFTTHNELKEKVFEFILNSPSNILEPSIWYTNFPTDFLYCIISKHLYKYK